MHRDAMSALDFYPTACAEFKEVFGRQYDVVEAYETLDAEVIVVAAGTITSVCRIVVDKLREQGRKVGLMKIGMLRPVPAARWREVLGGAAKVVVVDRNSMAGAGGVFGSEVRAALQPLKKGPEVYPVVAGVGGRDVTPEDVEGIIEKVSRGAHPSNEPLFWGLKE